MSKPNLNTAPWESLAVRTSKDRENRSDIQEGINPTNSLLRNSEDTLRGVAINQGGQLKVRAYSSVYCSKRRLSTGSMRWKRYAGEAACPDHSLDY